MQTYREDRWDKRPTVHRYLVEQTSDGDWLVGTISYDAEWNTWKPLGRKPTWQEAMDLVNYTIQSVDFMLNKICQYN